MNPNEAKQILLLYRPDTADAEDPQIAEALAVAKSDPALARWLEAHCGRQRALRDKFRQITVPAGLLEQIISEQAASQRATQRKNRLGTGLMLAAGCLAIIFLAWNYLPDLSGNDVSFPVYKNQMAGIAESSYNMELFTNNLTTVRAYLARNGAPADFNLPAPLAQTTIAGCAIENWNGRKVSLVCFRTGAPRPPNQVSDLWLFVIDRQSVKQAPATDLPQLAAARDLFTAAWTQDGKLYLLGLRGNEAAIRKYL
jgi:hypothetical protein